MENVLESKLYEAFATASETVYIYVTDLVTGLTRWSKNAVDYFDLPGEYIKETNIVWQRKIHPDDINMYISDIKAVFEQRKSQHDCRYRAQNKYGDYVWVECRGSIIVDEEGKPSLFAGIMTRVDSYSKYDALTDVLNINEFYQFDFSVGHGAVMLIGIDEFRKIVSSHGYEYGDKVLVEFAKKLKQIFGKKAYIYRFGGDEFLIVCQDATEKEVRSLFKKLSDEVTVLDNRQKHVFRIGMSAGMTFYPEEGTTKEQLVNNLEHSLEYAKKNYRGELVAFNQEIADMQKRAQILYEDLKNSIRNEFEGFELYFQPLIRKEEKKIVGCEALLRWSGEHIKDSYPGEFIKVLEDHGDICDVGLWVMEEAMKHQKKWEKVNPEFHVSFNVSYQQFMDDRFVDILIAKAKEIGVVPSNMIIELTESCHVEEPESLAIAFQKLRENGFTIALDDFGTAYSSMEILKYLPVNYIKIEHSFVKDLGSDGHEIDYIIIESLLSLCRKLNCQSVVEGVENRYVKEVIENMDVTYLQGYYFSKPVPEKKFEELLEKDYHISIE